MIDFNNVVYRDGSFALTANFSIHSQRFVAVLGPSGAGKSTLLNLIAGFCNNSDGDIRIHGDSMTAVLPAKRPVSLIFQNNNSFSHLNAFQNVALGISPGLKLSAVEQVMVTEALEAVGIAHLAGRKPGEMSGGEQQRIALARVLVRKKPVLLLDEAFVALGPGLRREMLALVKSLHSTHRLTTLMVTHQPEDAEAIADDVIFVSSGKARAPVAVQDFFNSNDREILEYLGR
jgi:thiamine transport system ATP-binding protein